MEGLEQVAPQLLRLSVGLPLVLLAVSVHAAGQAWMAARRGDPTALEAGRGDLWPWTHFDAFGCVFLPAILLFLGPLGAPLLGYGRPVPVDPGRLRRPKADFSLAAVAGPAANLGLALGLAFLGAVLFRGLRLDSPAGALLTGLGIGVNVSLASLQLLPLPGFDGSKALYVFLPDEWCWQLQLRERWFLLLLALGAALHALDWLLYPGLQLSRWLCAAAGIPLPAL